ncbi:Protein Ves [Burkholderiaceae bacterium]|nr:Protein Ves [Burkholderiaceae bacterium]
MSATVERIELRQLTPQRWKNGAGLTREIAAEPRGATVDDFDWRASVADISGDAPFSAFHGVERCIVLLRGAGMTLHLSDGRVMQRLDRPLEPFFFSGDDRLDARLVDGPSEDFNLMLRRGRFSAQVLVASGEARVDAADATLVLCCEGSVTVETAPGECETLEPGVCLLWRHAGPRLALRPAGNASRVLVARLQRLCQDGGV